MASHLTALGVAAAALLAGCGPPPLPSGAGVAVVDACPESGEVLYFPEGVLPYGDFEESDMGSRRRLTRFLQRIGEPSLWCGDVAADEEYRFTWERTWDDPMTIRFSRRRNTYSQTVVVIEGPGGFTQGPVKQRSSRELTREEWLQITAVIDRLEFWTRTTDLDDLLGNDGASWTIEARRDGRYHWVSRWSGQDGMEGAGREFLEVAGVINSVGNIY